MYDFYHGETRLHACTNSLNLSWGKWDVVPVEMHNTTIRRCHKLILPWVALINLNIKEKLGGVVSYLIKVHEEEDDFHFFDDRIQQANKNS